VRQSACPVGSEVQIDENAPLLVKPGLIKRSPINRLDSLGRRNAGRHARCAGVEPAAGSVEQLSSGPDWGRPSALTAGTSGSSRAPMRSPGWRLSTGAGKSRAADNRASPPAPTLSTRKRLEPSPAAGPSAAGSPRRGAGPCSRNGGSRRDGPAAGSVGHVAGTDRTAPPVDEHQALRIGTRTGPYGEATQQHHGAAVQSQGRRLRSVRGGQITTRPPWPCTWCDTVSVRASRSKSHQRNPVTSPRRRPSNAARGNDAGEGGSKTNVARAALSLMAIMPADAQHRDH